MNWLSAGTDVVRSRWQKPSPKVRPAEVEVQTTKGLVVGAQPETSARCIFRGVPFAKAARFRAPVPVEPWQGPLHCRRPGKRCPQPFPVLNKTKDVISTRRLLSLTKRLPDAMSEECLFLDVYTPALDGRRPVICFIHGGAFIAGSGSGPMYSNFGTPDGYIGSRFSDRSDVVLVTVNYRLGAFGFLKVHGGDANCGLRDQVAALEWIAREIVHFGGDPSNVTIMGQSAGGMSCGALIAAPAAQALFHKAIVMSGSLENVMSVTDAHKIAEVTASFLGREPSTDGLEDVSSLDLVHAQMGVVGAPPKGFGMMPFQPYVDGEFLPDVPLNIVRRRREDCHRYLVGYTSEEWRLFNPVTSVPIVGSMVGRRRSLNDATAAVQESLQAMHVPLATHDGARELLKAIRSDFDCAHWGAALDMFTTLVAFVGPAKRSLQALSVAAPEGTFAYIFDFTGGLLGPAHAMELPLLFGTYDTGPILKWLSGAPNGGERVSADMMSAFGAFAHGGAPVVSGVDWAPYSETRAETLHFGHEPTITKVGPSKSVALVLQLLEGHTRPFGLHIPTRPGHCPPESLSKL